VIKNNAIQAKISPLKKVTALNPSLKWVKIWQSMPFKIRQSVGKEPLGRGFF
jgi:hypothetical protein